MMACLTAKDQFMTQLTQAYEDYAVEAEQSQAARALDDMLFAYVAVFGVPVQPICIVYMHGMLFAAHTV
jgi:hypothetical protein